MPKPQAGSLASEFTGLAAAAIPNNPSAGIKSSDAMTMPKIAPPNSAVVGSSSGFARTHDPPKNQSWHPLLSTVGRVNEVKFAAEVGASDGAEVLYK